MRAALTYLLTGVLLALSALSHADPPTLLSSADLSSFPNPVPDVRLTYGEDPSQYVDLRLPESDGPHPVVINIHGGCWLSEYDIRHSDKLAAAIAETGAATWNIEYRRVGNPGGGWPGTFHDIARAVDLLRDRAAEFDLDSANVVFMGHSAGGHLALWAAGRGTLPASHPLASPDPLIPNAVIALAPASDLEYLHEEAACGDVVDKLVGGSPTDYPERFDAVSPMQRAAPVPQVVVLGSHDEFWRPVGARYYEKARARGDEIELVEAPLSGHFEMIDPDSETWPLVLEAVNQHLVDGR